MVLRKSYKFSFKAYDISFKFLRIHLHGLQFGSLLSNKFANSKGCLSHQWNGFVERACKINIKQGRYHQEKSKANSNVAPYLIWYIVKISISLTNPK